MNKLVAIVGMSGSGKSIASDYLESKNWNKIYFGGVVLDQLKKEGLEINPKNEKKMRESLREKYGMAAMATILLPKIEESIKENDTVLDGLYSWDEYKVLNEKFGSKHNKERIKNQIIGIDKVLAKIKQMKLEHQGRENA